MTTNKKEINKKEVEVKKENLTANEIIFKFEKDTKGLLKTSLGTRKTNLYKDNVLPTEEKAKKSTRKKLRNILFSISSSILQEDNNEKKEKLINSFNDFYTSVYRVNDYTLQSVCNENLNKEKKDIILKALEICKK